MAQHLRYFSGIHPILQGEDGAGVPEVREADMVQSCFLDNFIVHPAHHLGRVGLLRGWVHEHERTAGMPGVFRAQELYNLLGQADGPGATFILQDVYKRQAVSLWSGNAPASGLPLLHSFHFAGRGWRRCAGGPRSGYGPVLLP